MKDKKMANQQASHESTQIQNTSISVQNARLAGRVEQGSIDTFAIMRELNICRPSARISAISCCPSLATLIAS